MKNEQTLEIRPAVVHHKRPLLRLIALVLAVLLPLPFLIAAAFLVPDTYGDTFLGALSPKLERLRSVEGKKIVVVGGSSVAFGLDSALLAEHMGYEVVNFGLYATLGTRIMMDLSLPELREGDIVILAPESDPQTLSMYFGGEALWQAADSDPTILAALPLALYDEMAAAYPAYLAAILPRFFAGEGKISPEGIYRSDSFNVYGDISYPRAHNVMVAGYDVNKPVRLAPDIFDAEFIEYVNSYIAKAERRGARVFYSFCPVNESALSEDTDSESIAAFYQFVAQSIHCPIISDPNALLMHENYFYDTNFHLNDAGVRVRTATLIGDLRRALGITQRTELELPAPPARPQQDPSVNWVENEWSDLYMYVPFGDGLAIVGVAARARGMEVMEIPYRANGKTVVCIKADAFAECTALRELTFYDNLALIENGAFRGADRLEKLHIRRETADDLEVGGALFDGAPDALRIYLYTNASYQSFLSGYWWSAHSHRMVNAAK